MGDFVIVRCFFIKIGIHVRRSSEFVLEFHQTYMKNLYFYKSRIRRLHGILYIKVEFKGAIELKKFGVGHFRSKLFYVKLEFKGAIMC